MGGDSQFERSSHNDLAIHAGSKKDAPSEYHVVQELLIWLKTSREQFREHSLFHSLIRDHVYRRGEQ